MHKPSRLRHEIRPDSSDDGRGLEKDGVQEPRSDIVLLETQFDAKSDYSADDGLDIADKAIIQRNAATKTSNAVAEPAFMTQLFSKAPLCPQESHENSTSTPFSFMPAKTLSQQSPSKHGTPLSQFTTQADTANVYSEENIDLAGARNNSIATPGTDIPPESQDAAEYDNNTAFISPSLHQPSESSGVDAPLQASIVTSTPSESPESISCPQNLLTTQSKSDGGIGKAHALKLRKLSKKILRRKQPGPWPPRSSRETGQTNRTLMDTQCATDAPINPQISSPFGKLEFCDIKGPEKREPAPSIGNNPYNEVQSYAIDNSQATDEQKISSKVENIDLTRSIPLEAVCNEEEEEACCPHKISVADEKPSEPAFHQTQPTNPVQLINSSDPICAESSTSPTQVTLNASEALPPPTTTFERRKSSHDALTSMGESVSQPFHLREDFTKDQHFTTPCDKIESHSHQSNAQRSSPHRIDKPRKRPCGPSGLSMGRVQGPTIPVNVGNSLENLRVALLADQTRIQYEHTLTAKHYEENTAVLRDLVASQNNSLLESKEKHQELQGSIVKLIEKSKTSQKYAKGLQGDYENLKKSVETFQKKQTSILKEKIAEIEIEKTELEQEFEKTLEVLSRSQKKLRDTVVEFYARLRICESEKKDLAQCLYKQKNLYQDEYKRRSDLEKHLVSAMQTLQYEFSNKSTILTESINGIQSSLQTVTANDRQIPGMERCLMILQNLQTMPLLTTKDVRKTEAMLRFTHECIQTRSAALIEVLEQKFASSSKIQEVIVTQFKDFKSDMVKYNEVAVENAKVRESNNLLKCQLGISDMRCSDLEKQLASKQKEVDLQVQSARLVREVSNLDTAQHNHQVEPQKSRQEEFDIYRQLEEANEKLKAASMRTRQMEEHQQQLAKEVAKHKGMYEACKSKLSEAAQKEMLLEKIKSAAERCLNSEKQLRKDFSNKESDFKNDIHRLTVERDEYEAQFQDQQKQTAAAKNQMHELRSTVKNLTSELEALRTQKNEMETESTNVKRIFNENLNENTELTSLKDQIQHLMKELQSTKQNNEALHNQHIELSTKARDLQTSNNDLQNKISQQHSTTTSLRADSASQLTEERRRAEESFQAAQDEILALRNDQEDLLSRIQRAETAETKLYNAQATFAIDRDALQQQLAALRAESDVQNAEKTRLQAHFADEKQKLNDKYRIEIDDWARRFAQSDTELKETQAKLRRKEAEHQAKIESDHKETEHRIQRLQEEFQKVRCEVSSENSSAKERLVVSSSQHRKLSPSPKKPHSGNGNQAVNPFASGVHEPPGTWRAIATSPSTDNAQKSMDIAKANEDFSLVSPADGIDNHMRMSNSSEKITPSMSPEILNGNFRHNSDPGQERRLSMPNNLSSISSEELTHMQPTAQPSSPQMPRDHNQTSPALKSKVTHMNKSPLRSESIAVIRSQARPRSQANTASRLMPPPGHHSHHFKHGQQDYDEGRIKVIQHAMSEELDHQTLSYGRNSTESSSCSATSSLDFMHSSSGLMLTNNADKSSQDNHSLNVPQALQQGQAGKRKRSDARSGSGTIRKKQHTYLETYSDDEACETPVGAPQHHTSSTKSPRARIGVSSSQLEHSSSEFSRSKTQKRSSNNSSRKFSQVSSPSHKHGHHNHKVQTGQSQATYWKRDNSSRLTRSKSRQSNEHYGIRFSQELGSR